jgi:hypothetical protein
MTATLVVYTDVLFRDLVSPHKSNFKLPYIDAIS